MAQRGDWQDIAAGMVSGGCGAAALIAGRGYALGSAAAPGAGLFPTVLGGLLLVCGLALAWRGLRTPARRIDAPAWRALLAVMLALLVFAFGVRPAGLLASSLALVLISRQALPGLRAGETLLLAAGAALGTTMLFHFVLAVPLPVLPALWEGGR